MIKKVVYTEFYCDGHYQGREVEVTHNNKCKSYYNDLMTLDTNVMNYMRKAHNVACENVKVSGKLRKRITTYIDEI